MILLEMLVLNSLTILGDSLNRNNLPSNVSLTFTIARLSRYAMMSRKVMVRGNVHCMEKTPRQQKTKCTLTDLLTRSRSVRNLAVDGESGSSSNAMMPATILKVPKIKKIYIHCGRPVVMWPTAYPMRLPNIVAIPLVQ